MSEEYQPLTGGEDGKIDKVRNQVNHLIFYCAPFRSFSSHACISIRLFIFPNPFLFLFPFLFTLSGSFHVLTLLATPLI